MDETMSAIKEVKLIGCVPFICPKCNKSCLGCFDFETNDSLTQTVKAKCIDCEAESKIKLELLNE